MNRRTFFGWLGGVVAGLGGARAGQAGRPYEPAIRLPSTRDADGKLLWNYEPAQTPDIKLLWDRVAALETRLDRHDDWEDAIYRHALEHRPWWEHPKYDPKFGGTPADPLKIAEYIRDRMKYGGVAFLPPS